MGTLMVRLCAVQLLFLLALFAHGFAEERAVLDATVYLTDADPKYPYLWNLWEGKYFSASVIPFQYHGKDAGGLKWNNKINIISDSITRDDVEFAAFRLRTYDFYFRMMKVDWEMPGSDASAQGASIGKVLEFVLPFRETDPHEVLRRYALSPNVRTFAITYEDTEKESAISGYAFELKTPLSSTHRFYRTVIGLVAIIGLGEAWYWSDAEANKVDWRYDGTWKDFGKKLGDGWTLDTNSFELNTINHTYTGATYYTFARSNEYDIFASFLFAATGSLVWEYAGEFRERVSLNDMVFTTLGGSILGEGLHNASIFVENKLPKHFLTTVLCFVIDPMREINRFLDYCYRDEGFRINVMFMSPGQMLYEREIQRKTGN